MSRKLSIESVSDPTGDDLLYALIHQAFRTPTVWGSVLNTAFALVIFVIGALCWAQSLVFCGSVLFAVSIAAIGLRRRCLRRQPT
ncbi:MAG: hypothetical protein OEU46_23650 [Alphaproteobacteria bacterium]|nr:hypothetical protein [Alphaproteobacteria bacterium]